MKFMFVRTINTINGESIEESINKSVGDQIRVWSDFDDQRFPRAGCTLQNCETLVVDDKLGEVYAVNTNELMKNGVHLPAIV